MGGNNSRNYPYDPRTGRPVGPLSQPGYYPGYHTLSQQEFWDAKTRAVVLERVLNVPPIRFFTEEQARLLETVCAQILPQDDRDPAYRIPLVPAIDKRLYENHHDGYRYADMPPDQEAYTLGLEAIDEIAHHLHGRGFVQLGPLERDEILKSLHDGKPAAGHRIWRRMPVLRFWQMLVQDCVEVYYAHPWAWDEIGYGGPAYPRAYVRLEHGAPEPWESDEHRYEWKAPDTSVSDIFEPIRSPIEHPSPHRK
jgi:hypothetical protein